MAQTIGSIDLASLKNLRDDVTQYFWFESDSSSAWGSGAHVTLYPESQFTDSTSPNYMKGQNIIMNTDGFSIRNGGLPMMVLDNNSLDFNVVDTTAGTYKKTATFSSIGARIGQIGESHFEVDYHSLQMIDKEGDTYLWFSDLRDSTGYATVTERIVADYDDQDTYYTTLDISSVISVKAYGWSLPYTLDVDNKKKITITFTTSVPGIYKYDSIEVEYVTTSQGAKAYTIGKRGNNSYYSPTIGIGSVAEGIDVVASGTYSHAEGFETEASSPCAHAEGDTSRASGVCSHAEGMSISRGKYSHAEGMGTGANGLCAHAEGFITSAGGEASHSEGESTDAKGDVSHAGGLWTIAQRKSQYAIGEYNIADTGGTGNTTRGNYAFIIGNGTADNARSNALTVDWNGNVLGQAMAGVIQMFAGTTPPTGWLVCDGASYLRSNYPTLFEALGGTSSPWGLPDSTHFQVPDLRGRAPIGAGTGTGLTARAIGDTFGEETHTLIADEVPAHTHGSKTLEGTMRIVGWAGSATNAAVSGIVTVTANNAKDRIASSGSSMGGQTNKITATHTHTSFGGGGAHENMQPSAVVNFIICTGKTS